jgi:hypothetical protein
MWRVRLAGAAGGGLFAVLVVIALAVASGPASASGATVEDYYSAHGAAALWQAILIGFGLICFIWFAGVFAEVASLGTVVVISASVTAALYLVVLGAWESLGEIYMAESTDLDQADAHVLYDVGVGASHLVNFAVAAFVGATALSVRDATPSGRRLGLLGLVLTVVLLVNAPFQIVATSHWSDVVGAVVFIGFLAWVFASSAWLVSKLRHTPE